MDDELAVFKKHNIKLLEYIDCKTIVEYKYPHTDKKIIKCDRILISRRSNTFKQKKINKNGNTVILVEGENFYIIEKNHTYHYYKNFPYIPVDIIINNGRETYILCENNYLFSHSQNLLITSDINFKNHDMSAFYLKSISNHYFSRFKILIENKEYNGNDYLHLLINNYDVAFSNCISRNIMPKIIIDGKVADLTEALYSCLIENFRSSIGAISILPNISIVSVNIG